MQFILGVVIFKEPFDHHRLIGFGVVWVALILIWCGKASWRRRKYRILARGAEV